jgi:ferredoxin
MAIKKIWVEADCTACGVCEGICPEVFLVKDIATVIEGVNYSEYEVQIKEAADSARSRLLNFLK